MADPKEWTRFARWIRLKRVAGSRYASYAEAWSADDAIHRGLVQPTLLRTYPLFDASQGAIYVFRNHHQGQVGVVCLAPGEGPGVRDPELRERHLEAIMRFRDV